MNETEQNPHEMSDEARDNLVRFFDTLIEMDQKQKALYSRLKKEPEGFPMSGDGRNCGLCGRHIWEEDGWFDKWGFKCLTCKDAINKRKIPGSLCGDYKHERSIPDTDLAMKTGIHIQVLRKYIREGKIKGRKIPNGPYMILRKDNPNILDVIKAEQALKTNSKSTK